MIFDFGRHAVLGAEVQHLLRLSDAADHRTGQTAPATAERERRHGHRMFGDAQFDQRAVGGEQVQVVAHVQVGRHRVQDQVEAARQLLEGVRVARRVVLIGAEAKAVFHLLE